jgi:hypothetical protein
MGIERGALAADQDTAALLSRHWLANKERCNTSALTIMRIGRALSRDGIGCLAFKGVALGQALYPATTWRHCGDIDILVSAGTMARAAEVLMQAGLGSRDPVFALPPTVRRFALRTLRDIQIDDRQLGNKIELHSRLLFSQAISSRLLAADQTFRPRLPEHRHEPPVPAVGAGLAYYLLLHGAISGWTRLKWLTDIQCILRQLDQHAQAAVADLAECNGTVKSVKASLHLAATAFPAIELGPLRIWLTEPAARNSIRRRTQAYAAWLSAPSDRTPNPMHVRSAAVRSTVMLVDGPWAQAKTFPSGGLAAGLRILAKRMQVSAASKS